MCVLDLLHIHMTSSTHRHDHPTCPCCVMPVYAEDVHLSRPFTRSVAGVQAVSCARDRNYLFIFAIIVGVFIVVLLAALPVGAIGPLAAC